MVICISAILFSVFFAWLASRVKNKHVVILCSIISILIPAIVGGIRQIGVGTDTKVYGYPDAMAAYTSQSFAEFMASGRGMKELGYQILCYATMKTLGHVNWCFFFYQLITVGCFYVGAYKHRKVASLPLTMLCFFGLFYYSSFNIIRQSMAASILFMGINNLEEKKYRRFMAYMIAAFMFHSSSVAIFVLILLPYFIIAQRSYLKYFILASFILSIIFIRPIATAAMQLTSKLEIVPDRYFMYTDISNEYGLMKGDALSGSRGIMLFQLGVLAILFLYAKRGRKLLGSDNFNFYSFNFLLAIILRDFVRLFSRLVLYNDFICVVLYSSMPNFVKDKYFKLLLTAVVIFRMMFFGFRFIIGSQSNTEWAYRSILDY